MHPFLQKVTGILEENDISVDQEELEIAEIVFADNIVSPDGVWNVLAITNTVAYKNGVKLNITTNRPSNSARTVCTTASSSFSFSAEL